MVSSPKSKVLTEPPEDGERTDYDASNPKNVKDKDRALKLRQEDIDAGLRLVMSHRQSRAWMWSFLGNSGQQGGIFADDFHTSNSVMARNGGMRVARLEVMAAIMQLCPELYLQMQAEQQLQQENDQ